jgi:hypothetical protein
MDDKKAVITPQLHDDLTDQIKNMYGDIPEALVDRELVYWTHKQGNTLLIKINDMKTGLSSERTYLPSVMGYRDLDEISQGVALYMDLNYP